MMEPNDRDGITPTVVIDPLKLRQRVPSTLVVVRDKHGEEHMAVIKRDTFTTMTLRVSGGEYCCGDAVEAEYGGAITSAVVLSAEITPGGKWNLVLRWGQ